MDYLWHRIKLKDFCITIIAPVSIEIEDGKITQITRLKEVPDDFPQVIIAPGFFDNQVNGFAGVSFAFGGSDLTFDKVEKATQELWKKGVTTYFPTLTTNAQALLVKNLKILAAASDDEGCVVPIPGFHLEGPYINPEDGYRGAHPLNLSGFPTGRNSQEMNNAANHKIMQITIAPELEGALDFIRNAAKKELSLPSGPPQCTGRCGERSY